MPLHKIFARLFLLVSPTVAVVSDEFSVEDVSPLFAAIGHPARIRLVLGLYRDESVSEVVERLEMSRSAVQQHLERLIAEGLVYRPDDRERTYALTPIGTYFALYLEEFGPVLDEAVDEIKSGEARAREELEPLLSGDQLENSVEQRKWELVGERLAELLDTGEVE